MIKTSGKLTHTLEGGRLTLKPTGEIDHHSAVALREEADALIYRTHPEVLAIDLSSIEFMDSSGLGLIMGRLAKTKEIGTSLIVQNPSKRVMRMLKMAGLDRMIPITKA